MKRAARLFPFAALFAASFAAQLFVLLTSRIPRNADQAMAGLIAKHILDGRGHPVFFYGSTYGGTVEPHFMAVLFAVFGVSPVVYRGGLVFLLALTILGITATCWRGFGPNAALGTLGYLVVPPFYFLYKELTSDGVYAPVTLASVLCVLAGVSIAFSSSGQAVALWSAVLGLSAGVGLWVSPVCLPVVAVVVGWLAFQLRRDRLARLAAVSFAGFMAGGSPWWIWNLRHQWRSLHAPEAGWVDPAGIGARLHDFLFWGVPVLTGTARVNAPHPFEPFPLSRALMTAALLMCLLLAVRRAIRGDSVVRLLLAGLAAVLVAGFFSNRFVPWEPRILVPAYVFFAPLAGVALADLFRLPEGRLVGVATAACLAAVHIASLVVARRHIEVRDRLEVTAPIDPLLCRMEELGIRRAWTDYWTSYRIDFESRERTIAAPLAGDEQPRYVPYQEMLREAPQPAVVLLPPRARSFEAYLKESGAVFQRDDVGAFVVFTSLPPAVVELLRRAEAPPLPGSACRPEWVEVRVPKMMKAGVHALLAAEVRNSGSEVWPPSVQLRCRWRDGGGTFTSPTRAYPDGWTQPGGVAHYALDVEAPRLPGRYSLEVDLEQREIGWFSERGGRVWSAFVDVQ